MISQIIATTLSNLPVILFVVALLIAWRARHPAPTAERYLAWLLLLSVGVDGVWAGFFHVFFPGMASARIGWAPSPFEFEIGVADMAAGIVAIVAFWRSLAFQSAAVLYTVLFYVGVAAGHFQQAYTRHDFAPDNFGLLLVLTLVKIPLLSGLLYAAWRARRQAEASASPWQQTPDARR